MTEVKNLLAQSNLSLTGKVKWNKNIDKEEAGVYIIALTSPLEEAPIDIIKIEGWKMIATDITLDNQTNPPCESIKERLSQFWFPDEKILYIGQTKKSIRTRIRSFYSHKLGKRSPHAGGHWLKTLKNLDGLDIYFAVCDNPQEKENELLRNFINNISKTSKNALFDSERPFPFANLTCNGYGRKQHKIGNSRV